MKPSPEVEKANLRIVVERAMVRRMLETDPWTYAELGAVATRAGGNERDADRFMQKWRRKGWATFVRMDGRVWWSPTEAGRIQNTPLFQEPAQ